VLSFSGLQKITRARFLFGSIHVAGEPLPPPAARSPAEAPLKVSGELLSRQRRNLDPFSTEICSRSGARSPLASSNTSSPRVYLPNESTLYCSEFTYLVGRRFANGRISPCPTTMVSQYRFLPIVLFRQEMPRGSLNNGKQDGPPHLLFSRYVDSAPPNFSLGLQCLQFRGLNGPSFSSSLYERRCLCRYCARSPAESPHPLLPRFISSLPTPPAARCSSPFSPPPPVCWHTGGRESSALAKHARGQPPPSSPTTACTSANHLPLAPQGTAPALPCSVINRGELRPVRYFPSFRPQPSWI